MPGHSTETASLLLLDNIFHAANSGKSTLLVSLNLSAAFDTIEHSILLQRLIYSFSVTGTALSWIKCYLTDRNQSVCIGQHSSPVVPCSVGVLQGSVLGLLLFSIYTSSIAAVAHHVAFNSNNKPTTHNFILPSHCPIHLLNLLLFNPV